MRNSIGNSLVLTLSGESHGEYVCAVLDGLASGISVDESFVSEMLSRRRPCLAGESSRCEKDEFKIVSGVLNGFTTGSPLTILIPNLDCREGDYDALRDIPRPSHADYAARMRYLGFEDYRGGGHFSGRITAGIVAAGAIVLQALERKGIRIATHILSCAGVKDRPFSDFDKDLDLVNSRTYPVLGGAVDAQDGRMLTYEDVAGRMEEAIAAVAAESDSVGGVVQTAVTGLEPGLGEPWFDSLDSAIARAAFSIGGVKAVEFGLGMGFADARASRVNDGFTLEDGKVVTVSNNCGGVTGGLSNGMPLVFNCAIKPTPSISRSQNSVNLSSMEECTLSVRGRHDSAIVRRVCVVLSCITALTVCDLLLIRHGTDFLR